MGIKVTVVTLYDDASVESYVAVVHGEVSDEKRRELAERFDAGLPGDLEDEEDARVLYFREVETCDSADDVTALPNVDGAKT